MEEQYSIVGKEGIVKPEDKEEDCQNRPTNYQAPSGKQPAVTARPGPARQRKVRAAAHGAVAGFGYVRSTMGAGGGSNRSGRRFARNGTGGGLPAEEPAQSRNAVFQLLTSDMTGQG